MTVAVRTVDAKLETLFGKQILEYIYLAVDDVRARWNEDVEWPLAINIHTFTSYADKIKPGNVFTNMIHICTISPDTKQILLNLWKRLFAELENVDDDSAFDSVGGIDSLVELIGEDIIGSMRDSYAGIKFGDKMKNFNGPSYGIVETEMKRWVSPGAANSKVFVIMRDLWVNFLRALAFEYAPMVVHIRPFALNKKVIIMLLHKLRLDSAVVAELQLNLRIRPTSGPRKKSPVMVEEAEEAEEPEEIDDID